MFKRIFVILVASLLLPIAILVLAPNPCPVRDVASADLFPHRPGLYDMGKVNATSQWSRKYKTDCVTCHTVFPRLNYYGEQFMQNGFQDPDDSVADGGTKRKKTYGGLDIGRLEDFFGARISAQPLVVKTNGVTENGSTEVSFDVGGANWLQFFTAGTITKNVTFFNELEINADGKVKHGWFIFGFHNVLTDGLINFQMGKVSPVEWTSFSNRLRIFPEIKGFADKISSSSRAASGVVKEDSTNISSSQWGVQYYGYKGPVIWAAGVGNSGLNVDLNQQKNFWGSLRADYKNEDSEFEGSSISMFGYHGTDSANTSTAQIKNNFWRLQPSFNVRWKDVIDVIGSFHYGNEDNMTLTAAKVKDSFWGITGIFSYLIKAKYQLGIQYDTVHQDKASNLEDDRLAFHASYLLKDNINLILTADTDLTKRNGTKNHQFLTTIRAMF